MHPEAEQARALRPLVRSAALGTVPYADCRRPSERSLVEARRQRCAVPDLLLLLEHPHVITMGPRPVPVTSSRTKRERADAGESNLRHRSRG